MVHCGVIGVIKMSLDAQIRTGCLRRVWALILGRPEFILGFFSGHKQKSSWSDPFALRLWYYAIFNILLTHGPENPEGFRSFAGLSSAISLNQDYTTHYVKNPWSSARVMVYDFLIKQRTSCCFIVEMIIIIHIYIFFIIIIFLYYFFRCLLYTCELWKLKKKLRNHLSFAFYFK